jgi:Resolvase, N terminal domain
MTTHDSLLPAAVLQRKAVVYVRQSTPQQVQSNLESQRRQYGLVEVARQRGFTNVEVIDDDLGRTASGAAERPGFDRLVADLCAGKVGAVLCLDALRLARNGRDWHHLLELCGLVEARVIDSRWYLRSMPTERPPAARHEGKHQRVRTGDHSITNVRSGTIEGATRRAENPSADRLHLGSGCRSRP